MLFYGPGESVGAFCFSGKKKPEAAFVAPGTIKRQKENATYSHKY